MSALRNSPRPQSLRMRSAGHIASCMELPAFQSVLSHGTRPKLVLPSDKQQSLIALEQSGGSFLVLGTALEQGSPAWFSLIEQGKRAGLSFQGFYTCETNVLQQLAQELQDSTQNKARAKRMEDNAVIQTIVSESEQIDWFRNLVMQCVDLGATDIHLEISAEFASVRIRRDGLMRTIGAHPAHTVTHALSACYTLLAEDRSRSEVAFNLHAIQSAMIPLQIRGRNYVLRYQSHPTVGGFEAVLRILKNDTQSRAPTLDKLGYADSQIDRLVEALGTASGGLFIAGITGSGKTTTLSAMLGKLAADGQRKIISIEDPVEYQVNGVSHLSVQRSSYTNSDSNPFAPSMLAFLRMDPDIGMFGEIRDHISGQMAYTAIQTGHKLLTTVHATSALGIVSRLCSPQIGMLRSDICNVDFLSALVYQALVPLNCPHCKVPATQALSAKQLQAYETLFQMDVRAFQTASSNGCSHCCPPGLTLNKNGHNGVSGMKVSAEVIEPDSTLLDLLRANEDLKARAYWRGQQTSRYDEPDMRGKPAWAHTLFDMSQGLIDPYYFEHVFGPPALLATR